MKKAIWGAGYSGNRFMINVGKENIDFFIDVDRKKKIIVLRKTSLSSR